MKNVMATLGLVLALVAVGLLELDVASRAFAVHKERLAEAERNLAVCPNPSMVLLVRYPAQATVTTATVSGKHFRPVDHCASKGDYASR